MKKIVYMYISIVLVVVMSSCSSMQTISVCGKPGTLIYTPDMDKIAVIPDNGITDVVLSKENTYHYLLSKEINNDLYVPFGLDFNNKSIGSSVVNNAYALSGFMAIATGLTAVVGSGLGASGESYGWMMVGIGFGVMIPFTVLAAKLSTAIDYDQYKYKYKYLTEQQTNQDILLSPLKQTADYKTVSRKKYHKPSYEMVKVEKNEIKEKKYMDFSDNKQEEKPIAINNSSCTDSKSKYVQNVSTNHSQQVVGTYYGYGRLMSDNELVERYDNLKIVVSKRTSNMVKVDVYIRNSIPYFSSANIYNISKTYNEYTLHHTTNDSYITIDENGILNFTYKNIRNKGYVLKATAEIK